MTVQCVSAFDLVSYVEHSNCAPQPGGAVRVAGTANADPGYHTNVSTSATYSADLADLRHFFHQARLQVLHKQLKNASRLADGWADEGTPAPSPESLAAIKELLDDLADANPIVSIIPTTDGHMALTQRSGTIERRAEVQSSTAAAATKVDIATGDVWQWSGPYARDVLVGFFTKGGID